MQEQKDTAYIPHGGRLFLKVSVPCFEAVFWALQSAVRFQKSVLLTSQIVQSMDEQRF